MSRGLDELLEFLLEEVALRGDQVVKFYDAPDNHNNPKHGFFASGNGEGDAAVIGTSIRKPLLDDRFLEKVWGWLIKHSDIRLNNGNAIEKNQNATREVRHSTAAPDSPAGHDELAEAARPRPQSTQHSARQDSAANSSASEHRGFDVEVGANDLVVRTTEDRMWRALAGHGVDFKRIRQTEFTLLSIIGAAGPKGIRQTLLTEISGQDKRSLPHRTDELFRKGYIEKKQLKLKGQPTSLCTLRRWVKTAPLQRGAAEEMGSPEQLRNEIFHDNIIHADRFLEITLQLLRGPRIMLWTDLRKRINLEARVWERRATVKYLQRMEVMGCIKRIGTTAETGIVSLHSIKYIQEPSAKARENFAKINPDAVEPLRDKQEVEHGPRAGDEVTDLVDEQMAPGPPVHSDIDIVPETRVLTRWDPDRPLGNLLFELADDAGRKGISSMEYAEYGVGSFWKRPLEHTLSHLTDIWQESQPPHLRHLALVRDTAMQNRYLHYQYRTYDYFGQAVEAGDASWEAVNAAYQKPKKKAKIHNESANNQTLDAWGFPSVESAELLGPDGSATLSDCRRAMKLNTSLRGSAAQNYAGMKPSRRRTSHGTPSVTRKESATPRAVKAALAASKPPKAVRSRPLSFVPIQYTPVLSLPVLCAPTLSAPVQSAATQSAPISLSPTAFAPILPAPVPFTPATIVPTTSAPVPTIPVPSTLALSPQVTSLSTTSAPMMVAPVMSASMNLALTTSTTTSAGTISTTPASTLEPLSRSGTYPPVPAGRPRGRPRKYARGEEPYLRRPGRVSKEDQDFISQTRNLADYLARHELGLTESASTIHSGLPYMNTRKKVNGDNEDSDHAADDVLPLAESAVAFHRESSLARHIQGEILAATPEVADAIMSTETAGSGKLSIKRTLPSNLQAALPAKRQKTSDTDSSSNVESLKRRIDEIHHALLTMSRPGLYIDPPKRKQKVVGRSLKQMIAVFKTERLRKFDWFRAETDTSLESGVTSGTQSMILAAEDERDDAGSGVIVVRRKISKKKDLGQGLANNFHMESSGATPAKAHVKIVGASPSHKAILSPRANVYRMTKGDLQNAQNDVSGSAKVDEVIWVPAKEKLPGFRLLETSTTVAAATTGRDHVKSLSMPQTSVPKDYTLLDQIRTADAVGSTIDKTPQTPTPDFREQDITLQQQRTHRPKYDPHQLILVESVTKDNATQITRAFPEPVIVAASQSQLSPSSKESPYETLGAVDENPLLVTKSVVTTERSNVRKTVEEIAREARVAKKRATYRRKEGVLLSAGMIGFKRSQTVMQIVEQAGGVFPGDREMWYPYVTAVRKSEPNARPDPHTIARAVKNVVDSGKMKKITFAFKDKNGVMCTKRILMLPHISVESEQVKDLQKKMIEHHPKAYMPPNVEVDPKVRFAAEQSKGMGRPRPYLQKTGSEDMRERPRLGISQLSLHKPAWQSWAVEANLEGANLHMEYRTVAPIVPKYWREAEDFEDDEDISDSQAALQSTFRLDDYSHDKQIMPRNSTRTGRVRYSTLQPWHKRKSNSIEHEIVVFEPHGEGRQLGPTLSLDKDSLEQEYVPQRGTPRRRGSTSRRGTPSRRGRKRSMQPSNEGENRDARQDVHGSVVSLEHQVMETAQTMAGFRILAPLPGTASTGVEASNTANPSDNPGLLDILSSYPMTTKLCHPTHHWSHDPAAQSVGSSWMAPAISQQHAGLDPSHISTNKSAMFNTFQVGTYAPTAVDVLSVQPPSTNSTLARPSQVASTAPTVPYLAAPAPRPDSEPTLMAHESLGTTLTIRKPRRVSRGKPVLSSASKPYTYQDLDRPLIRPKAWIAGLGEKYGKRTLPARPEPPQAYSMQFSFSEAQQASAARLNARSGVLTVPTLNTMIPFAATVARVKAGFAEYVTLTDPEQNLHMSSGTISTEFAVIRRIRPQLKINPDIQRNFEDRLLEGLVDILEPHSPGNVNGTPPLTRRPTLSFEEEIARVQKWEEKNAKTLTSKMSLSQPRFINFTMPQDVVEQVTWPTPVYKGPGRTRQPGSRVQQRPVSSADTPPRTTRTLRRRLSSTSTPPTHEDYVLSDEDQVEQSDSNAAARTAETEQPNATPRPRRVSRKSRFKSLAVFSEPQLNRFIAVVVVVRSLLGGIDGVIDWDVVGKLNPEFDSGFLRTRWNTIRLTKRHLIKKMQSHLHGGFVQACEDEKLPLINYDNVNSYEWDSVISWTLEGVAARTRLTRPKPAPSNDLVQGLPADRLEFDRLYDVVEVREHEEFSRDDLYILSMSNTRREELTRELSFSLPVTLSDLTADNTKNLDEQAIAKSFVRANVFTPGPIYNPDEARTKLLPFGEKALDAAVSALLAAKVIKSENKSNSGRNYAVAEHFYAAFKRSFDVSAMFHASVQYKRRLDASLAAAGHVEFSYHAPDADVLVLMNLVAVGRLKVEAIMPRTTTDASVPAKDPETGARALSIWGFTDGSYKTMQMDRDNLLFKLRVSPTDSYVVGVPLPLPLPPAPSPHLRSNEELRIPLWYDIQDGLLPELWETVLAAVMTCVVLRPGCAEMDIVAAVKGFLEVWEVEWAVGWLIGLGVVGRFDPRGAGGLIAREWWWAVFGAGSAHGG